MRKSFSREISRKEKKKKELKNLIEMLQEFSH